MSRETKERERQKVRDAIAARANPHWVERSGLFSLPSGLREEGGKMAFVLLHVRMDRTRRFQVSCHLPGASYFREQYETAEEAVSIAERFSIE